MCDCVHEHPGFTLPSLNMSLEGHEGRNMSLISLDPQEAILNCIFVSGPMHSHKINVLQFLDPSSETNSLDAYYLWILYYLLKRERKTKNFRTCKLKSIQIITSNWEVIISLFILFFWVRHPSPYMTSSFPCVSSLLFFFWFTIPHFLALFFCLPHRKSCWISYDYLTK